MKPRHGLQLSYKPELSKLELPPHHGKQYVSWTVLHTSPETWEAVTLSEKA